jgi:mono/diheme cytochrome c family protein
MRFRFACVALALITAVALPACSGGTSKKRATVAQGEAPVNAGRGRAIYLAQCSACHGRDGTGGQIGPQLRNEHLRHTFAQVRDIVLDPEPPMPKLFPARMTGADVRDVSAYVETL